MEEGFSEEVMLELGYEGEKETFQLESAGRCKGPGAGAGVSEELKGSQNPRV